jgi:hypothetical protein
MKSYFADRKHHAQTTMMRCDGVMISERLWLRVLLMNLVVCDAWSHLTLADPVK